MKTTKRIMLAALLLVILGAGMIVTALARGNFDWKEMTTMSFVTKTYEVTDAFSGIAVKDIESCVRLVPSADGRCRVSCPEEEDGSVNYTVSVTDGVLNVQCHDERRWYQHIGIFFDVPEVEIWLPEEEYQQLAVSTVSGRIEVAEGLRFEEVSLESVSGSVHMHAQAEKALKAESKSGRVTIENASPEQLNAKTSSGRIELAHIRCGGASARSTAGRIELTDVIAEKDLFVKNTSGSVNLDGCDAGGISIETTSGAVKGTLLTDKIFMASSSSGRVEIPRSNLGGDCEITTTSGSIRIEIAE